MLDDTSSDDDFLLPDNSAKPKETSSGGTPASVQAATPTFMNPGGSAAGGTGGDSNYASNLLANRRRGMPSRSSGFSLSTPTSQMRSPTTRASPTAEKPASPATKTVTPMPSLEQPASPVEVPPPPAAVSPAAAVPPLHPTSQPSPQGTPKHSPTQSVEPIPTQANSTPHAQTPKEVKPVLDQARIDELKAQVQAKKDAIAAVKQRESKLLQQQKQNAEKHQEKIRQLDADTRRVWQDVEESRSKATDEVSRAEQEKERFLREERTRIEEEVANEAAPRIAEKQKELQDLQQTRDRLQHGLSMSSSNKNLIDNAIAAALSKVMDNLQDHFKEKLQKDDAWEADVSTLIQREIKGSFSASVAGEADAERAEHSRAFKETLAMWREAEDEERQQISKMDEQLLLDLQSMAHDDMDRLQREEMSMQEVYMATREAWAQHHRANLNSELEAALQRRSIEFEDQRTERQQLSALRVRMAEQQHERDIAQLKKAHATELQALRELHAQKQLLNDEKGKMQLHVKEEAAKATKVLTEVVSHVNRTLDRLDNYKTAVDESRAAVDQERQKQLTHRESTLSEVQSMVTAQATAIETERRALSGALVKLDVVHASIEKQLEDERGWIARNVSTLERSRGDWEREYRRWQHVAQQEKLDAEQRFSGIIMDLRQAAAALDDEGKELDVEANALRRHCSDRSSRSAQELAELQKKEDELTERYNAMVTMVQDVERRSQQLTMEWQTLHAERQQLAGERQDLAQEEQRLQALSENLKNMRHQIDNTHVESAAMHERASAIRHGVAMSRDAVNVDLKNLQEQSDRLGRQRERLAREQSKLNDMALGQHRSDIIHGEPGAAPSSAPASRLPNRVMTELQEMLNKTAATQQQSEMTSQHQQPSVAGTSFAASNIERTRGGVTTNQSRATHFDASSVNPSFQFTNMVQLSDSENISQQSSS